MAAYEKFSPEDLQRYARHIILPQVGGKGQRQLLNSRVFMVGAGGLGSPILLYLAAAGVGTIEVIDADQVNISNLQRQVVHTTSRIGTSKVESAKEAIQALNPSIRLITHNKWLTDENALDLFANADVVIDGSDNFPTRYLVNDACYFLKKPLVSGAMYRFEGQLSVFLMDHGADSPCYRCLFPEPPEEGAIPTCEEAGIFGVIPGVIGSLQAAEVIKLLLGIGDPLIGRLLLYDGLTAKFREVAISRNPDCPLNGDNPKISTLEKVNINRCDADHPPFKEFPDS